MPNNLSFKLRTGRISSSGSRSKHNYSEKFIQDQFWIVGIDNVREVAQKCNFRIEVNKVNSSLN